MLYHLPESIREIYRGIGRTSLLYTIIKWALTPFEKMEEYVPHEGKIYDLGCGNGLFSHYLAMKSSRRFVTGVDLSFHRIKVAKSTAQDVKNINFYREDVNKFKLAPCDCIIFSDFLHHLSYREQENLIQQSSTNLKKGGVLIIKEIDTRPKWKFIISFILDSLLNFGSKLYHRSSNEFKELLTRYGFMVEIIPMHRLLPLTNIIYVARRLPDV